jgi:hypothetical protein
MRLTNKHDLPTPFVNFSRKHEHDGEGADFTVSGLLDAPQITRLKATHAEKLTHDVGENIMSLIGTAIHNVLEQGADPGDMIEERFHAVVDGVSISGQADRMVPKDGGKYLLQDWKSTSGTTLQYSPDGKPEWEQQVNLYVWLAGQNGFEVDETEIVVILRDWKKSAAKYNKSFPQRPVVVLPVKLWDNDVTEQFIRDRIEQHTATQAAPCTPEERWMGADVYAVRKYVAGGGLSKRAVPRGLHKSSYDAEEFMLDNGIHGEVEVRPGVAVRCKDWCEVAPFCKQYQDELGDEDE